MIIDAHCHAGWGDGYTGPWDTHAPLGPYLRRARQAGIGRTIIFPVFNSDYTSANRRLARIVASRPDRLTGFGAAHPLRDADRIESLVDEAVQLGLRGLKVHGLDATPTHEVLAAARRHGLTVLLDVVGRIDVADDLASSFPEVPIIVAHLGAFGGNEWAAHRQLTPLLLEHPNLYADTSGVRFFEALADAGRLAPHKLVFGSDGPSLHPGVELAKVRALGLPPPQLACVLGGTITRLLAAGRPRAVSSGRRR
jgi:uncharacterized protein